MAQMFRYAPSGASGEVLFSNVDRDKGNFTSMAMLLVAGKDGQEQHRWELPGNHPVLTMVMVIYYYIERIWRIIVTFNFLYNIHYHE